MKIAVAAKDGQIAQNLGTCAQFTLVTVNDDGSFVKTSHAMTDTGNISVVSMLAQQQVDVLICGELGLMTRSALQMIEITIVPGCTGDVDVAIDKFLRQEPQGDPSILAVEIEMDEDDPMQCMHDCAKCSGCGGEIPEAVRKRIPEI